ncbi:MAG: hypothetical protein INR73_18610 [Williamsia sp.]|nr:hypothetical protein [Williamsia sp.]
MSTITGNLFDLDTKDSFETSKAPKVYNYKVKASGGGKLSFKVELCSVPLGSPGGTWSTIEEKSDIASGVTASGQFNAAASGMSDSHLRFTFTRKVLTHGVSYELNY